MSIQPTGSKDRDVREEGAGVGYWACQSIVAVTVIVEHLLRARGIF